MNITIVCSSKKHPIYPLLYKWVENNKNNHTIKLIEKAKEAEGGDILFLISCSEIVKMDVRQLYKKSLVIHASDLPHGRGWSPHIWQILEGRTNLTISLLEAEDEVDTGDIWKKINIHIPEHFLWNEVNNLLFSAELNLIDFAINNFSTVTPKKQNKNEVSYFRKRVPKDSKIDIKESISESFNKIRISDPNRFPAYFEIHGHAYKIVIEKMENNDDN